MAGLTKYIAVGGIMAVMCIYCVDGESEADLPPVFIEKPQNTSVWIGKRVVLKCRVKSGPRATIKWLKDGKQIRSFRYKYFYKRKKSVLIMYITDQSDAGKFTCIAKNIHGSVSTDVFLTVITYSAPVFKQKPTNVTLFTGDVHTMACEAAGLPDPDLYWFYNGAPLQDSTFILVLPRGGLLFTDVRRKESGQYTCLAKNFHGFVSADAYLSVIDDPTVVKGPRDLVKANDGSTAVFTCSVASQGTRFRLIWRKDGNRLRRNSKYEMTGPVKDGSLWKFSLKIRNINLSDNSSSYQCKAVKNKKSFVSQAATLIVLSNTRPQVNVFKTFIKAQQSSNVTAGCVAKGFPLPDIHWFKDSIPLESGPNIKVTVTPTSRNTVQSSLLIGYVSYKDEGSYICAVSNTVGQDASKVTLFVYGKPQQPTNIKVNQTSVNKIVVSWVPGYDGGDWVEYLVGYRQNGSTAWTFVSATKNQTSISLEIMIGVKLFFFQVKAKNKYGISSPSEEVSFKGLLKPYSNQRKPRQHSESGPSNTAAVIGGVHAAAAFVLVVIAVVIIRRKRQQKLKGDRYVSTVLYSSETITSTDECDESRQQNNYAYVQVKKGHYATPSMPGAKVRAESSTSGSEGPENEYDNICQPVQYEVPKRNVILEKEIGSGHFGRVFKGYLKVKSGRKVVAVKMLKADAGENEKKSFIAELEFMKSLSPHPNIVGLVGCCTKSNDAYILVEYCSMGNLQTFLRSSRAKEGIVYSNLAGGSFTLRSRDLLSFAWQIARGMAYLAGLKCVHRDLAARNILVAEANTCKIADFGLARDIYNDNQYIKKTEGELPLRWMAYESIFHGVTTTESDVWSFGVLLWEIVTLGANPYPKMRKEQIIASLHLGNRMPKPPYCSDELYAVMWQCWQQVPGDRPSFSEIGKTLERLMTAERLSIDLANFDPLYANSNVERPLMQEISNVE